MGTLRSSATVNVGTEDEPIIVPAVQGFEYNGVVLGQPVEIDGDPSTFEWDDAAFPNGTADVVAGELIVIPDESGE